VNAVATLQRGPDPDMFRTSHYGARWYCDPLPGCELASATDDIWPSVTTIKKSWAKPFRKKLPDGSGAVPLDAYWAAEFVVDNLAAINALSGDRDAAMALICGAGGRTLNRAANRGSATHEILETLAAGGEVDELLVPNEARPFLAACRAFVADWSPEFLMAEVVALNRTLSFGGTFDSLAELDARRWLVDYKSRGGEHGCYEEDVAQLGGYSLAEYIVLTGPDGVPYRAPMPEVDGVMVVSLNASGYAAYPVDLVQARRAFVAMQASWREHREGQKAARAARGHPLIPKSPAAATHGNASGGPGGGGGAEPASVPGTPPPSSTDSTPAPEPAKATPSPRNGEEAADQGNAGEVTGSPNADDVPAGEGTGITPATPERMQWLRDRIAWIYKGDAGADLERLWRVDQVPVPSAGGHTNEQVSLAAGWCYEVEATHGFQFGALDPLVAAAFPGAEAVDLDTLEPVQQVDPLEDARLWTARAKALLDSYSYSDSEVLAIATAAGITAEDSRMSEQRYRHLEAIVAQLDATDGAVMLGYGPDGPFVVATSRAAERMEAACTGPDGKRLGRSAALTRAKQLAKDLGLPAPRGLAKAAENPLLAALVAAGHGAPTNNQENNAA